MPCKKCEEKNSSERRKMKTEVKEGRSKEKHNEIRKNKRSLVQWPRPVHAGG
jgi:hypothetical protein